VCVCVCASTLVVFALAVSERVIEQIVVATRTPNNAAHALRSVCPSHCMPQVRQAWASSACLHKILYAPVMVEWQSSPECVSVCQRWALCSEEPTGGAPRLAVAARRRHLPRGCTARLECYEGAWPQLCLALRCTEANRAATVTLSSRCADEMLAQDLAPKAQSCEPACRSRN
jgi:hypothetical protein